jgi:uncharacterized membrane protein YraQ (UPF0718 family)
MDRLSILLTLMSGPVLTGAFVITAFTLGFYGWTTVLMGAVFGFVLSWPAGYAVSRLLKRHDRNWDHTAVERTSKIPEPGAPEV